MKSHVNDLFYEIAKTATDAYDKMKTDSVI